MSGPARFKQQDVTRAVKGFEKAGIRVGRVEIAPDGRIIMCSEETVPKRRGTMDHIKHG